MSGAKKFTYEEVAKHKREGDVWLIIRKKVYDITEFIEQHPGGGEVLLDVAGRDATQDFDDVGHSEEANKLMADYYIGELDMDPQKVKEERSAVRDIYEKVFGFSAKEEPTTAIKGSPPTYEISSPSNFQHKLHVNIKLEWSNMNPERDFKIAEKLGEGTFGKVYRAIHKETLAEVAVKILKEKNNDMATIEKEMQILSNCEHPNITNRKGYIACEKEVWMIMDYCGVGSLDDMMNNCKKVLTEDQIAYIAYYMLKGLGFLHSKKIVHGDIKAANVLLTDKGEVKIADFGVAAQLSVGKRKTVVGSPYWMSPEAIRESAPYDYRCDIWSLGITFIELAEGEPPLYNKNPYAAMMQIQLREPPTFSKPEQFSKEFTAFVSRCLKKLPEERATIDELLTDPFLHAAEYKKHYLMPLAKEAIQIKRLDKTRNTTMDIDKDLGSDGSQTGNSFEKSESLGDDLKGSSNSTTPSSKRIDQVNKEITEIRDFMKKEMEGEISKNKETDNSVNREKDHQKTGSKVKNSDKKELKTWIMQRISEVRFTVPLIPSKWSDETLIHRIISIIEGSQSILFDATKPQKMGDIYANLSKYQEEVTSLLFKGSSEEAKEILEKRDKDRALYLELNNEFIQELQSVQKERKKFVGEFENQVSFFGKEKEIRKEVKDSKPLVRNFQKIIEKFSEWQKLHENWVLERERTDKALNEFLKCFEKEVGTARQLESKKEIVKEHTDMCDDLGYIMRLESDKLSSSIHETESIINQHKEFKNQMEMILSKKGTSSEIINSHENIKNKLIEIEKKSKLKKKKLEYLHMLDEEEEEKKEIASIQVELEKLEKQAIELNEQLSRNMKQAKELVMLGYPELLPISISKEALHTGLFVNRSLKEFSELKKTRTANNILIGTWNSKKWALKRFLIGDEPKARKQFEKEVSILGKLNHPLIVKMQAAFFDGHDAYIQMPFIEEGSMEDWLFSDGTKAKREIWDIRTVLQHILYAISYIHRNGIVHKDLKLTNILMSDMKPILCDFGISKDVDSGANNSTLLSTTAFGTPEYIAPELLLDRKICSFSLDLWSFGVIAYKALFGNKEVLLLPRESSVTIPPHEIESVGDFLKNLLCRDPKLRMTAEEALCHPFFSVSISKEITRRGTTIDQDTKINAFRSFVGNLRVQNRGNTTFIKTKRSDVVKNLFETVRIMSSKQLLGPVTVQFVGEEGVDLGALTSSLYREFFSQIFREEYNLFERSESGATYIPKKGADKTKLELFGKILAKLIYDERVVEVPLATPVFKYLQKTPSSITIKDLQLFDPDLYLQLSRMQALPVKDWGLDFSDVAPGGEERFVDDSNKQEYISLRIQYVLQRKEEFDSIKRGFRVITELLPLIDLLSYPDLKILISGSEFIAVENIKSVIIFQQFNDESPTKSHFFNILDEMSQDELKKFLVFVTEQPTIPLAGFLNPNINSPYPRNAILIRCTKETNKLPVSHVCFYLLDLPDYRDQEILRMKLMQAISNTDTFETK